MKQENRDLRHYIGAAGIFMLIITLLVFLSFVEVPPVNKDLFVAIVGTLVSSLGIVVYTIIGQQPDEVNSLTKKNEALNTLAAQMEKRNDQLEEMIIKIQRDIIHKLTDLKGSAVTMLKDQSKKAKESGNILVFLNKHPDYPNLKCLDDMKGRDLKPLMECNGFCGTNDLNDKNITQEELNNESVV